MALLEVTFKLLITGMVTGQYFVVVDEKKMIGK